MQIAINLVNMLATMALVLGWRTGIAGAALATVLAEASGLAIGLVVAGHLAGGSLVIARAALFDRVALARMLSVNRDIMIRTAALIAAFLFFAALSGAGARSRRLHRRHKAGSRLGLWLRARGGSLPRAAWARPHRRHERER